VGSLAARQRALRHFRQKIRSCRQYRIIEIIVRIVQTAPFLSGAIADPNESARHFLEELGEILARHGWAHIAVSYGEPSLKSDQAGTRTPYCQSSVIPTQSQSRVQRAIHIWQLRSWGMQKQSEQMP
jgi:hypothetical protein